jgi:hypothetical protein
MPFGYENGNIFHYLGNSKNLSEEKVKKFFEIIQKYLDESEILGLMENCNENQQTIFEILVKNLSNFKPFIDGAENFFKNKNFLQISKYAEKS